MDEMNEWREEFEKWLVFAESLQESTAKQYSGAVKNAGILINIDPSTITNSELFWTFYREVQDNPNRRKTWMTGVYHFRDYLEFKDGEPYTYRLWEIVDEVTVTRKTDGPFYRLGSGIPLDLRPFFNICDLERGEKRDITLVYDGKSYDAYLFRESVASERTRIFWNIKLKWEFHKFWLDVEDIICLFAKFVKLSDNKYALSFTEYEETIKITEKETQTINEDIKQRYRTPRSPEDAESILNQISKDLLEQPVKIRKQTGYALSRNPEFALLVKERANYVCEICGTPGFEKTNGGLYAEAHHMDEIAIHLIDNPHRMICVCPTCHRIIHHGTKEELEKRKTPFNQEGIYEL